MLKTDRDAVVCDLAETYGIFDYRALPAQMLAMLVCGLRDDSRIKMKIAGARVTGDTLLMAAAVDRLSMILWGMTDDARTGRNRPGLMLPKLMGKEPETEAGDGMAFSSEEDFERERSRILERIKWQQEKEMEQK